MRGIISDRMMTWAACGASLSLVFSPALADTLGGPAGWVLYRYLAVPPTMALIGACGAVVAFSTVSAAAAAYALDRFDGCE